VRQRFDLAISVVVLSALLSLMAWGGCGGPDLFVAGQPLITPTTTAGTMTPSNCFEPGEPCSANTDCCSGSCVSPDGITLECQ